MLSILRRGTVEAGNDTWEFHGDNENDKLFYITPLPTFVMDNGLPKIQIVEFDTSGPDDGSGYCQLEVQLGVSDDAMAPVKGKIKTLFGVDDPIFETLAIQSGTIVNITYPDGAGGTTGMQVDGTDFGSNVAIVQIPLDADQMKNVKGTMTATGGSPFQIEYVMSVPSFMPAVTAELSFDAKIAYNYQVTKHEHTHWARSSTYTYDISASLKQSDAAKITVNKVDPNVPDDVVNAVRDWGQTVIEARVAEEVKKAIALQESGTGTQPFSVSEISSFTETYEQTETIMWRLRPQSVLPSFADLGLTSGQIESLEPTIDKRRFIVHITPNADFVGNDAITLNSGIDKGKDSYMGDLVPLTKLEVTVRYPTLTSSAQKTFTFTGNDAHTWEGDWDNTAGGVFSLDYAATYNDGQQVSGSKEDLDVTMYTLGLADIGTINVTFNATKFFVQSEEQAVVDSLTVDFVLNIPQASPFLQTFHMDKDKPTHTVRNDLFAAPATTDYAYTLTYNFKPDTSANPFTSNVKRQNSQMVFVDAPDFKQSVPIRAMMGPASNPFFLELDINIYYEGEPYFPDIPASAALPRPTQSSPIQFSIPARTGTQPGLVSEQFTIFANSSVSPLLLSAQGITGDGSTVTWGPVDFDPITAPNLPFFETSLFTFFEIDPTIVDWKIANGEAGLKSIDLRVTAAHYNTKEGSSGKITLPGTTVPIAWDPQVQKAPAAFYFANGFPDGYSDVSFDWEATYVYSDGAKVASGNQKGTILALPKEATESPPTNTNT